MIGLTRPDQKQTTVVCINILKVKKSLQHPQMFHLRSPSNLPMLVWMFGTQGANVRLLSSTKKNLHLN